MGNVGEESKEQGEINSKCDYWTKRWIENKTGWHVNSINGNLMLYLNVLTGFSDNHSVTPTTLARNAQKKFFVPLCGKTRDLAYLRGLGFQIFAVECAQLAIEALDKENNFKLKYDEKNSIYYTEDGKLKIFYGDFFKCPLEKWGPFDYVWDRGSLIAVEYSHRPAYIKMMQRSVKVQNKYYAFRYLLETVEYDRTKYAGPPRVVEERDVKELYSPWTNYQLLEKYTLPEAHNIRKIEGMGPNCNQALYIITPKN